MSVRSGIGVVGVGAECSGAREDPVIEKGRRDRG